MLCLYFNLVDLKIFAINLFLHLLKLVFVIQVRLLKFLLILLINTLRQLKALKSFKLDINFSLLLLKLLFKLQNLLWIWLVYLVRPRLTIYLCSRPDLIINLMVRLRVMPLIINLVTLIAHIILNFKLFHGLLKVNL